MKESWSSNVSLSMWCVLHRCISLKPQTNTYHTLYRPASGTCVSWNWMCCCAYIHNACTTIINIVFCSIEHSRLLYHFLNSQSLSVYQLYQPKEILMFWFKQRESSFKFFPGSNIINCSSDFLWFYMHVKFNVPEQLVSMIGMDFPQGLGLICCTYPYKIFA